MLDPRARLPRRVPTEQLSVTLGYAGLLPRFSRLGSALARAGTGPRSGALAEEVAGAARDGGREAAASKRARRASEPAEIARSLLSGFDPASPLFGAPVLREGADGARRGREPRRGPRAPGSPSSSTSPERRRPRTTPASRSRSTPRTARRLWRRADGTTASSARFGVADAGRRLLRRARGARDGSRGAGEHRTRGGRSVSPWERGGSCRKRSTSSAPRAWSFPEPDGRRLVLADLDPGASSFSS